MAGAFSPPASLDIPVELDTRADSAPSAGPDVTAGPEVAAGAAGKKPGFEVRLANFTGPFDLLLGLISKHQLDITEVALSTVTDEFIKYIRGLQTAGGGMGAG